MQELSSEGLIVLAILLPGFLASELVRILSTRQKRSEFDKVIQAFIYSLLVYVCFAAVGGAFPVTVHLEQTESAKHYFPELHFAPLIELTAIAVVLAIAVAWMMNHDFPVSIFQRLGITQRTFRPSIWNDVFRLPTQYVQVELADGRNVIGWLVYFSDTPEEAALYLEDAAWLPKNEPEVPINGGIFLTKECGIRTIMFLRAVETSGA